MAWRMKHLLCKCRDESLNSQNHRQVDRQGSRQRWGSWLARPAEIGELQIWQETASVRQKINRKTLGQFRPIGTSAYL